MSSSSSQLSPVSVQQALVIALTSRFSFVCAILLTLISTYPFIFNDSSQTHNFFDLQVYFGAVQNWVRTGNLYDWALPPENIYGFTYPPFAAIVFTPLMIFPSAKVAGPFVLLGNVAVMVLVMFLSQKVMGIAPRLAWALSFWLAPLALLLFPLRMNMVMGQTNLVLLLLILADGVLLSRTRFSGILAAVAASVKMTPALFILYFIAKRDWGGVARFIGTGIAGILLSFIIDSRITLQFFTDKIFESNRVGSVIEPLSFNILGEFSRLFPSPVATVLFALCAIAVAFFAYRTARVASLAGQNLLALVSIGFLTLLVSPISWNHHWVWIIPALTVCCVLGIRKADSVYLFMTVAGAVLFTLRFEAWFSGNHWDIGEWPLFAVLMHVLPTAWSVAFIVLPLLSRRKNSL